MKIQLQTNILSTFFKKLHENFVEFCKLKKSNHCVQNLFFFQAEAKKRKILSVKNVDELTDEKIELYTNRMKETILKERTKATRQAAGNNKIDVNTTLTCLNESNPL